MGSISILCLGDSLTVGLSHMGTMVTPYATHTQTWLKTSWPETNITIDVEGLGGDGVCHPPGRYIERLRNRYSQAEYDWIIVLGGTNDLGAGQQPEPLFEALEETWKIGLDHGSNILALTIPECEHRDTDLEARKEYVNRRIMEANADGLYKFDLFNAIPNHSLTPDDHEAIWDDDLHFTPQGYGVMGDYIGKRLVELVPVPFDSTNLRAAKLAYQKIMGPKGSEKPVEDDQSSIFEAGMKYSAVEEVHA